MLLLLPLIIPFGPIVIKLVSLVLCELATDKSSRQMGRDLSFLSGMVSLEVEQV